MRDWIDRLHGLVGRLEAEMDRHWRRLSHPDRVALREALRDLRDAINAQGEEQTLTVARFDFLSTLPSAMSELQGNLRADPPYLTDALETLGQIEAQAGALLKPALRSGPKLGRVAAVASLADPSFDRQISLVASLASAGVD